MRKKWELHLDRPNLFNCFRSVKLFKIKTHQYLPDRSSAAAAHTHRTLHQILPKIQKHHNRLVHFPRPCFSFSRSTRFNPPQNSYSRPPAAPTVSTARSRPGSVKHRLHRLRASTYVHWRYHYRSLSSPQATLRYTDPPIPQRRTESRPR